MIIGFLIGLILIIILGVFLIKNRLWKIIFISVIFILIAGGVYFMKSFFSAFAPPKIELTKNYISTNRDFVNGVTIEKILVDSIGSKGYPVKYTTTYSTSCNIKHPKNKPPVPPSIIEFKKPGKYSWDEDTIRVNHIHKNLTRKSKSNSKKLRWLNKFGKYDVCPLKFERNQWYFIMISDPQITGIFLFIDEYRNEKKINVYSGVSPI
mgnify:CR=1 FL=1